jgi:hypothetical protein
MDIDHNNFHKIAREVYLKAVQKKYPDFKLIEAPPGNPPMSENWTTNSPLGQRSPLSATLELFSTPPPIEQNPNSDKFTKLFTCIKNLRSFFEERLEKVAEELLFTDTKSINDDLVKRDSIWKKDAMRFFGGITNAFNTYLGLARVLLEKASENGIQNAAKLKSILGKNSSLVLKLAQLPQPLLLLFNNMNGVITDQPKDYEYESNNFEISSQDELIPTKAFLETFVRKSSKLESRFRFYPAPGNPNLFSFKLEDWREKLRIENGCPAMGDVMNSFLKTIKKVLEQYIDSCFGET